MIDKIYDIKNKLIEKVEDDIAKYTLDKIDVRNLGLTVDMIKDLAEAEEKCWKARFYAATIQEMGGSGAAGYSQQGGQPRSGYPQQQGGQMRSGYPYDGMSGYGGPSGYGSQRMGYAASGHVEVKDLKRKMMEASPSEKRELARELQEILEEM